MMAVGGHGHSEYRHLIGDGNAGFLACFQHLPPTKIVGREQGQRSRPTSQKFPFSGGALATAFRPIG